MKKIGFFLAALILIFFSCKREEASKNYQVSGNISSNGVPVKGAEVNIDNLEQYSTTTDEKGNFYIKNVSAGEASLNVEKSLENGAYSEQSYELKVNGDLTLSNLKLPNPVSLVSITLDSAINLATITWLSSTSDDFREYKLYSHTTAGLDENTGTLEFVSTISSDTVFTKQLSANKEIYFRVFVMDDFGKMGGSNVLHISSSNLNLVGDGGFNEATSIATWSFSGSYAIDAGSSQEGTAALHGKCTLDTSNGLSASAIQLDRINMKKQVQVEAGNTYRLSFWYKVKGIGNMQFPLVINIIKDNAIESIETMSNSASWLNGTWIPQGPFKILDESPWIYYEKDWTCNSSSYTELQFEFLLENVWIDDLKMKVVQ